jgi:3-dehydroquinate dehydratase/shikimate dehydrogenase
MDGTARAVLALHHDGGRAAGDRPISVLATLTEPLAAMDAGPGNGYLEHLKHLTPPVRLMEVRADRTGDIGAERLRAHFPGSLIYTLRSTAADGDCADPADRRRARLIAAADGYDYIDLEADLDLHPDVLDAIPAERRVISWHGRATDLAGLCRTFDRLAGVKASLYRLAPRAETLAEAVPPLLLLKSIARDDVMAYGHGPAGTWTRVLTAKYGAPLVAGRLDAAAVAGAGPPPPDGDLPLPRLLADYPHRLVSRAERLYGTIGASTTLSLATLVQNTACRTLDLPALFLPFSTPELRRPLAELTAGLAGLGLPLHGATIVRPHKDAALALADSASPLARRAHSASLIVRRGTGWWADNEAAGVVATLLHKGIAVAGRRIAVIGCGGSGRAAVVGLARAGAEVTLVNRGTRRGRRIAKMLGVPFVPLRGFDPGRFSVFVHATPVVEEVLFRLGGLHPATVVFDLNYRSPDTPLAAAARAAGYVTIDGKDMLLTELARQFQLMTGRSMPVAEVAAALVPTEG